MFSHRCESMNARIKNGSFSQVIHVQLSKILSTLNNILYAGIAQEPFLCDIVCFSEYFASIPNYDCELLTYVIQCYDGHREECEADDYSSSTIGTVRNEFEVEGCPPLVTEPEPTTKAMSTEHTTAESATRSTTIEPVMTEHATLAPFLGCTVEVPPVGISTPSLSMAETSPTFVNHECIHQDEDEELQHCSMFGFSSLRPFPDRLYRSHLETCNIPWPRFLLMHPTMSIEVEGVVSGNDCDYTRLSKVSSCGNQMHHSTMDILDGEHVVVIL